MGSRGITSVGTYVPRSRLKRSTIANATAWANPAAARATGACAVCNWDEDSITLAVAAAGACVAPEQRLQVDALWLASTTLPFADRDNAVVVAQALALREDVRTLTSAASRRGATSALLAALESAASRAGAQLVVAADRRAAKPGSDQELKYGHAAAAVCVGQGTLLAEFLGSASLAADLVDQYRASGASFDYSLEERWVRDEGFLKLVPRAIGAALASAGVSASDVSLLAFAGPSAVARRIAQAAGLSSAQSALAERLEESCGDTGAAHPLLLLALALEQCKAGQIVLLVGFGQGVDAIVLRASEGSAQLAKQRPLLQQLDGGVDEPHYLRHLSNSALVEMDWGLRAERDNRTAHSVAWRRRDEIGAFVGGKCRECGTVQFPRARVCVNPDCRATDTLEPHPLAHSRGRVKSFTEDWLAFTQRPPLIYGNVELEGGGNLMMEMTDVEPGELAVGTSVRMAMRIKDLDRTRGFRRYFWKAAPVAAKGS